MDYLDTTKVLYQQNIRNKQTYTEEAAGKLFDYFMELLVNHFKNNIYCTQKSVYLRYFSDTYETVNVDSRYIDKAYLVELIKGKIRAAGFKITHTANNEFLVSGWADDDEEEN